MKPTLLILAAGIGSRYGGIKQLDQFGPNGETIIDYSLYDAIRAGFGKVVFEGKSLINTSGEIKNQKGELVCTGTGTFNKYPVKNNVNLAGATLKKV